MALSDLQVFSEFAQETVTETIRQQVEAFNAASNGGIMLAVSGNEGDYTDETFWKEIPGLVRRRDAYGSGAVTAVPLAQGSMTTVKVAGGTPPVTLEPQAFTWIQKNPEEAGVVYGEQYAVGILQDQLNTAIRGGVAAISNNANAVLDGTSGTASRASFVSASGLFGDRQNDIAVWVLHSKVMTDIFQENVANVERLFTIGDVSVMQDGFGRAFVMTDSAALVNATPDPDQYHTLGLVPMGITVEDNGDSYTHVETSNGNENIERSIQSEFTYNVGIKGYSWDKANGGASPTDAAIGTGTNWDQSATDLKSTAGVLLNTQ